MNGYELSRKWFDFCFENPEKISPNHSALYFFCIEHCNRLGWKQKFGLPSGMAKEAIGIRSYNTYIKTLNDLISFGFVTMVEKSTNQYSSNIIALSNFNKPNDKPLDKATINHVTKQPRKQRESTSTIDKPLTIEPINQRTVPLKDVFPFVENVLHDWQKDLDFQEVYANYVFTLHGGKWTDGQHIALMRKIKQSNKQEAISALDNCMLTGYKEPKPDWFKDVTNGKETKGISVHTGFKPAAR